MSRKTAEKSLPLGIVLRDIDAFHDFIHRMSQSDCVEAYEFTYRAPLFRCTQSIKDGLPEARGSLDKFDLYFREAIRNDDVRQGLRQQFRKDYARRFPGSEASDLFLASGDIFGFSIDLRRPDLLSNEACHAAWAGIQAYPYDANVISTWKEKGTLEAALLRGRVKLFLDEIHNRRRRTLPAVQQVMQGALAEDPVVIEVMVSAGLPGYFIWALSGPVAEVGGALVWLPG